jgi:hypothetical protein
MAKVRTQIQLEERQYAGLKRLAAAQGRSLSSVLRSIVDNALGEGQLGPGDVRAARLGFVGSGRDAEQARDVARQHDRYLYGGRRR